MKHLCLLLCFLTFKAFAIAPIQTPLTDTAPGVNQEQETPPAISETTALKFPELTGPVVDQAHVLTQETQETLSQKLSSFQEKTSNQVVVVTVPSLKGTTIEDYGYQLGRFWGIGEKGKNNGALLILAPHEREVRIEVGYGLEGMLTDAKSQEIIQNAIVPYAKGGEFNQAMLHGADAVMATLQSEEVAPPEQNAWQKFGNYAVPAFFGLFFLLMLYVRLGRRFGWIKKARKGHSTFWNNFGGGSGGFGSGGGGFSGGGGSFGGGGSSGKF